MTVHTETTRWQSLRRCLTAINEGMNYDPQVFTKGKIRHLSLNKSSLRHHIKSARPFAPYLLCYTAGELFGGVFGNPIVPGGISIFSALDNDGVVGPRYHFVFPDCFRGRVAPVALACGILAGLQLHTRQGSVPPRNAGHHIDQATF